MIVPGWLVKTIVTALIGLVLTGVGAWATNVNKHTSDHEKRVAVLEDHMKGIDESLKDIKTDQREILKRLPAKE